ncbi:MAG TPA: hypothetical protein VNL16_01035 [Chloroflexota bacterium]|nr:hypothetical protein [Chloroflexota bacterium]
MSDISTRVWLDERLWDGVRNRAEAEGMTIRELIPRLVRHGLNEPAVMAEPVAVAVPSSTPALDSPSSEPGPPVVALSDVYQCGVCGAQVRLGGLSNHLGRHLKEQQASDAERS